MLFQEAKPPILSIWPSNPEKKSLEEYLTNWEGMVECKVMLIIVELINDWKEEAMPQRMMMEWVSMVDKRAAVARFREFTAKRAQTEAIQEPGFRTQDSPKAAYVRLNPHKFV